MSGQCARKLVGLVDDRAVNLCPGDADIDEPSRVEALARGVKDIDHVGIFEPLGFMSGDAVGFR